MKVDIIEFYLIGNNVGLLFLSRNMLKYDFMLTKMLCVLLLTGVWLKACERPQVLPHPNLLQGCLAGLRIGAIFCKELEEFSFILQCHVFGLAQMVSLQILYRWNCELWDMEVIVTQLFPDIACYSSTSRLMDN